MYKRRQMPELMLTDVWHRKIYLCPARVTVFATDDLIATNTRVTSMLAIWPVRFFLTLLPQADATTVSFSSFILRPKENLVEAVGGSIKHSALHNLINSTMLDDLTK
ncbi:unnamed protein product [Schistocephalus solidus]|uniref:Uncharacterized protein n=1 Tax=Schistocephalus solidus TaxID=70667 RepID=A0A183TIY8_SCHSO|nr:unnamed protein product [Schistocephalus solidus]